ncbi:MAG TPA: PIN domain nuclease [Clostridiales bacterium]|nr:PIN domain nuclease [Clostridiales bacterium]
MKVLFDTNVVLDVLLAREPFAQVAAQLLSLADRGRIQGVLCATSVTTIHYLATKAVGHRQAQKHLRELLTMFEVAPVNGGVLARALDTRFSDYEDAVLHEAGRAARVAGIVTRNVKDFSGAAMPVFAPDELLCAVLAQQP